MKTGDNYSESNRVFDEFSPKKLILQARSAIRYTISRWYKILGFGLLCGLAGAAYSLTKKPIYAAEITFALDEGATQSEKNEYSGLAEELGLSTSLNAGGVFSSMTNIVELIRSRLLIEKTLKSSVIIDGKSLLFADFFLDSLKYREKWMKNRRLNFAAIPASKQEALSVNSILRNIYETLVGQNISISPKGRGTTIISVKLVSRHELFSKYFLEALMEEVTRYYIETKTQRTKLTVEFIQKRTDSIRNAYNSTLYGRAAFTDAHINPARQIATVSGEKQQTDVQILRTSYVELVRSLEAAKTALMRETPLIQYLDTPVLPLKRASPSLIKRFIIFFIIGAFISTCYLLARKLLTHIMKSRES
jgi:hypothetical protein